MIFCCNFKNYSEFNFHQFCHAASAFVEPCALQLSTSPDVIHTTLKSCERKLGQNSVISRKFQQKSSFKTKQSFDGWWRKKTKISCRRAAATICPRPSPPSVGAEAPHTADPTAPADRNVAVGSHAQHVPKLTAAAA